MAWGATTYTYDAAGKLTSEGGLWPDDTVNFSYANRLRLGLSIASPTGSPWTQSYGYDAARRLTSVTSPAGEFDYNYHPLKLQKVDTLDLPNGAIITNAYDSVARMTLTELMNSEGTDLDSYGYGYNQANQRTNVVRTAGDYVNYTYDNEGELKTAIGKEAGGLTNRWQEQFGYAYDAAGNLNFRTNNALLQTFNVNMSCSFQKENFVCEQKETGLCEQKENGVPAPLSQSFCRVVSVVGSAEDRALRGRNLSAV